MYITSCPPNVHLTDKSGMIPDPIITRKCLHCFNLIQHCELSVMINETCLSAAMQARVVQIQSLFALLLSILGSTLLSVPLFVLLPPLDPHHCLLSHSSYRSWSSHHPLLDSYCHLLPNLRCWPLTLRPEARPTAAAAGLTDPAGGLERVWHPCCNP